MDGTITHLTEAQLSELADGALAGAERDVAARHVEHCARCRAELAETRALLVLAREARGGVPAPPELWPLVAASTVHAARVRREVLRSLRGVLLLGALALVAATATVTAAIVRQAGPPRAPSVPSAPTAPSAPSAPSAPEAPRAPSAPQPAAPGAR